MLLQAALNGPFTRADHSAVPVSKVELARDAKACVDEGARAIHLHPRGTDGEEDLRAEVVDDVVSVVRAACGVPVGVSTGAWIEPDLGRRLALIGSWRTPDFASVNVSEVGSFEVMTACLDVGIGVEAGVWTVEDAELLVASQISKRMLRVLIEPVDVSQRDAVSVVSAIHAVLDSHQLTVPRLQHGDGEATWVLLSDAIRRGIDTRVGLEDTFREPDMEQTRSNAALIRTARQLGAGQV